MQRTRGINLDTEFSGADIRLEYKVGINARS